MYYIIVGDMEMGYGMDGDAHEYLSLEGVVGPFDTKDDARKFEHERMRQFGRTDVVKLTAPDDLINFYENKYDR